MGEVLHPFKDRGFTAAVHMADELFAAEDGKVYPITNWYGVDGEECPKEEAAAAVAGRGWTWFNIPLADFGIGPLFKETTDAIAA